MANVLYLLALLVSLTVWQCAADDACDSVECLPANELVCALDEETGELALFTNECVLRCANCRMDTEFKKVDIFRCSKGTKYVSVCPEVPVNNDNEDPKAEDPDDEIMVVTIDVGEGISDKVPSMFGKSAPLPLPLPLLAMGREILRSLMMSSQPHPPPPPPGGVTLIRADVKVDVNIHGPHRMPPPPPPRFAFPPPPPLALPMVLPPPLVLAPRPRTPSPPPPPPPQYKEPELPQQQSQPLASSAAPLAAHSAAAAAVALLLALAVAALHI